MHRLRFLVLALVPFALVATAFIALAQAEPAQQAVTPPQACAVGLIKSVDPDTIRLGDTAKVTLVMTHSCPSVVPPTDIVFLIDVSNSMTKGEKPRLDDPCGPDPANDPLATNPPKGTPSGSAEPPPTEDPGGNVPTACPTRKSSLPIDPVASPVPTGPGSIFPTVPSHPSPGTTPGLMTPPPTQDPGGIGATTTPGNNPGGPGGPTKPSEEPGTEDLIREVEQMLRQFLREPDIVQAAEKDQLRIALVAFESRPHTISWPTNKLSRITSGLGRLDNLPHGTTNAALGFYRAHQALERSAAQDRVANRVVVILTDGKFDQRTIRGLRTRKEVTYAAVAMGKSPDFNQLNNIVTNRQDLLTQRDYDKLVAFAVNVVTASRTTGMTEAVVQDELSDSMSYVNGSGTPTVTVTGQLLEWKFAPPPSPVTMTYEVQPLEPGLWPVSARADASWKDSEGRTGSGAFPTVSINVIPPTPTVTPTGTLPPTPTPTPTSTATVPVPTFTPEPQDIYLPILFKKWPPEVKPTVCVPSEHTVDVALVIDTSDSMLEVTSSGRTKLNAAIEAGQALVDNLKLDGGGDQVAVIGFNSAAHVLVGLSESNAAVTAALASLPGTQARGTKINLGLSTALSELTKPAHKPGNTSAVVMLTDGKQEGTSDEVRQAAGSVRSAGIWIYTVGIGDVDGALLQEIASTQTAYYYSPDAEGLNDIYRRIADVIPCP
jgi:Mg-chelatase subunit ChlD